MKVTRPPKLTDAHFNCIFYAVTGAGKTHLLGTANDCPVTSPMLLVNFNGGMLTLAGREIDIVSPTNFTELQEIYEFLREDNTKYRSVGVDTLTDEQRDISLGTLLKEVDDEMAYTDLGRDTPPDRRVWLQSAHQMRKLIRAFRDLSYLKKKSKRLHVFMTAHERVDEQSGFGIPAISGVVGLEAGGYVDVLARLTKRRRNVDGKIKTVRYLYTEEHETEEGVVYLGKNRTGRLGAVVKEPTISKIMEKWTA